MVNGQTKDDGRGQKVGAKPGLFRTKTQRLCNNNIITKRAEVCFIINCAILQAFAPHEDQTKRVQPEIIKVALTEKGSPERAKEGRKGRAPS